jgi:hypothetical protein
VRDAGRAALLTLLALLPGGFVAQAVADQWRAPPAVAQTAILAVAMGVAAAAAWRLYGRGTTARWLVAGVGAGLAGALLWV